MNRWLALALASTVACGGSPPAPAAPAVSNRAPAPAPSLANQRRSLGECDAFIRHARLFVACDKVPVAKRDAMQAELDAAETTGSQSIEGLSDELIEAMRHECNDALDVVDQAITAAGC